MSWFDHLQQAVVHHNAGRLAEAEALYRSILIRKPGESNTHRLLGLAARARGRSAEALTSILRAVALAPHDPTAYHSLVNLLIDLDQRVDACEWLERGLRAIPDHPQLSEMFCRLTQDQAIVAYNDGDPTTAIAWWERCFAVMSRQSPQDAFHRDLAERLTRIALVLERPDRAEACVRFRDQADFPGIAEEDIDVFAVRLHGFSEWRAAADLPGAEWVAPAEATPDRLHADYPDYLHPHIDKLDEIARTPVGFAGPAPIEVIQGFFVKDNYENFVISERQHVLYENKELFINTVDVPLVGITPGAAHGVTRLPRPLYRVFELDEPGIVLPSTPNYWHFMVDVLPKLMIRRKSPELARLPIYLYDLRGYHYEMLEIAGVPRDQVIDLKPTENPPTRGRALFRFRQAVIPAMVPYPTAYRWLRETFLPLVRPDRPPQPRRVFLSRRGAHPKHRIANDAAVGEMLAAHGFEVVLPEKLSVLETVEMAAAAEVIVAPIGAGTANHVFLPPNATWIHLNNPDFFHPASQWNSQMGTQVTYNGTFRHLTGRWIDDPATFPPRLVDRLDIPVEIDLDALNALVVEAIARL